MPELPSERGSDGRESEVLPTHLALAPTALASLPVGAGLLVGQTGATGHTWLGTSVELGWERQKATELCTQLCPDNMY